MAATSAVSPEVSGRQRPLPLRVAARDLSRSVRSAVRLLTGRRVRMPRSRVGTRIRFADGSEATIYRETKIDGAIARDPCVLEVCFRLRLVRGRAHRLFRWESMANTPLFVGFPGFVSKLWLSHDAAGRYRGLYQWDGPDRAIAYARALWWVLALVSERRSIRYHVVPHLGRDDWLDSIATDRDPADDPGRYAGPHPDPDGGQWWRVVGVP